MRNGIPQNPSVDLVRDCLLFWQVYSQVPAIKLPDIATPVVAQETVLPAHPITATDMAAGITATGISGAVSWAETAVPPGAPAETNYYLYAVCHWVYRIFF